MGTCRPKSVGKGIPYPCYLGILVVKCSLDDAGLRLGTEDDLAKHLARKEKKRKNKLSLDTTSVPAKQQKQSKIDLFFKN